MKHLLQFHQKEDGVTAVEYAVMLALILGMAIAAITSVGNPVSGTYNDSRDSIDAAFTEAGVGS